MEIAGEVGIRASALYHYFSDKTQLFSETFGALWLDQMSVIAEECDAVSDPTEHVVCFSNGLLRHIQRLDHPKREYIEEALTELPGIVDPATATDELVNARNALEHEILRGWGRASMGSRSPKEYPRQPEG